MIEHFQTRHIELKIVCITGCTDEASAGHGILQLATPSAVFTPFALARKDPRDSQRTKP